MQTKRKKNPKCYIEYIYSCQSYEWGEVNDNKN